MKIRTQQIEDGSEEVVIRYHEMTPEIKAMVQAIKETCCTAPGEATPPVPPKGHLWGTSEGRQWVFPLESVIYFESVDGGTYAYTEKKVCRMALTLAAVENAYEAEGFFRCSKSMVLNIYRIHSLKSEPGNRIDATMDNGEHVMISRRFSKELRARLKGGF